MPQDRDDPLHFIGRSELGGAPAREPAGQTRVWQQSATDNGARSIAFSSVALFAGGHVFLPDGIGWGLVWAGAWLVLLAVVVVAARGDYVRGEPAGLTVQRNLTRTTGQWTDLARIHRRVGCGDGAAERSNAL